MKKLKVVILFASAMVALGGLFWKLAAESAGPSAAEERAKRATPELAQAQTAARKSSARSWQQHGPDEGEQVDAGDAQLEADILAKLASNAALEEKVAALKAFMRSPRAEQSLNARAEWTRVALDLLRQRDLPPSVGARLGAILERTASGAQRAELERSYANGAANLSEAERVATVGSSSSKELLVDALARDESHLVKDEALSQLAKYGHVEEIEQEVFAKDGVTTTTQISALRALGDHAVEQEDLIRVQELSTQVHERDEFGRSPSSVANVAVAESRVPGKSAVMFRTFVAAYRALANGLPDDEMMTSAIVAGIALSQALWTDEVAEAAESVGSIRPFVMQELRALASQPNLPALHALTEFAVEFARMCSTEPAPACDAPSDARKHFRAELAALVRKGIQGTELAEMSARLDH